MVGCGVLSCKSRSERKVHGITFHSFPFDPEIKIKWLVATGRQNWQPTKYSKICSIHFDDDAFIYKTKKVQLKPYSVPKKHIHSFVPQLCSLQHNDGDVPDQQLHLKRTDYKCNECDRDIFGCRYVCVQCVDHDVCATCETRGVHALHYVLRVPADKLNHEVMVILEGIREIINIETQADQDVPLDELESIKCEIETSSDSLDGGNEVKTEIEEESLEISEFEHAPLTEEEATIEGNAQSAEPKKHQQRRKRKAPSDTHTDTPPDTLPNTQIWIPLDRVTEAIAKINKTQSSRDPAPSSSKTIIDPTAPTYEEPPDTKPNVNAPMTFDPEPGSVVPVFMNNILKCEDRAGFQPYQMHTSATSSSQPLVVSFIEPLQPARDLVIKTELPD